MGFLSKHYEKILLAVLLTVFIGLLAVLELLVILRLRKLRKEDKARKAAEAEAEKLASDDSPLEYI